MDQMTVSAENLEEEIKLDGKAHKYLRHKNQKKTSSKNEIVFEN